MDPRGVEAADDVLDCGSSISGCLFVSSGLVKGVLSFTEVRFDWLVGEGVGISWDMDPLGVEDNDDASDGGCGCWIGGGLVSGWLGLSFR